MPADKYRFVSPGVFITEVDQSQVPALGNVTRGPVIIGRAAKGPALVPTVVRSYNEFVQKFGDTVAGGTSADVWRNGNFTSPMYATYAAKAYLSNNSPITFVRLLGAQTDDAGTTKAAGAAGWSPGGLATTDAGMGAYGLFIFPSASAGTNVAGTLAAIFYSTGSGLKLSGSGRGSKAAGAPGMANGALLKSVGVAGAIPQFKISLTGAGDVVETKSFNFDRNSSNYIRAVFNTDPTRTNVNTTSTTSLQKYWLGETYEKSVNALSGTDYYWGMVLGLKSGSTGDGADFLGLTTTDKGPQAAATGWFISQDTNAAVSTFNPAIHTTELFKIHGLTADGEQTQKEIKISILDIRSPSAQEKTVNPYPSFTVQVRSLRDNDLRPNILETFSNCNLNPNSRNYIARKIGDRYTLYSSTTQRLVEYGNYVNTSRYIRVEMNSDLDAGSLNAELMPFGVKGPLTWKTATIMSGAAASDLALTTATGRDGTFIASGFGFAKANTISTTGWDYAAGTAGNAFTGTLAFPSLSLVVSSSDMGFADPRDAYFGANVNQAGSKTRFDESTLDLIRVKPMGVDSWTQDSTGGTKYQYVFTLDNMIKTSSAGGNLSTVAEGDAWYYLSGSRATQTSWTSKSGSSTLVNAQKISKFTTVLHGGFDGLDITDRDPFRNTVLNGGSTAGGRGTSNNTNYARAALNRAINIVADTEVLEFNLATMPGIYVPAFTDRLIEVCEDRGDALAVIDVENDYVPAQEGDPDSTTIPTLPNVASAITSMRARSTNSSYGCAFYPWVQTVDGPTGQLLWIPSSVAALGTMGSSAAKSELWFAPAGFNRGGLSKGAAGIAVTNVRTKLTSRERDDLYDVRINPIASFPSEGIVVFGQKTLQLQQSALDRINVRRLMIYLKKRISQIANLILFDQNVPATWARFVGMANPVLKDVQSKFGLEEYRLILDETTTTPELRDRNVMYAKVFLKPAKAIEFIAIDFLITSSGASFED